MDGDNEIWSKRVSSLNGKSKHEGKDHQYEKFTAAKVPLVSVARGSCWMRDGAGSVGMLAQQQYSSRWQVASSQQQGDDGVS